MRIAAVGELCEDVYLPEGELYPGGISSNFAYHAARQGAEAFLFGAVGDDEAGDGLRAAILLSAVDGRGVVRRPGKSARQRLLLEDGERVFCGFDPGVSQEYALGVHDRDRLAECDGIACSDGLPLLLADCQRIGPRVIVDFSQDTDGNESGRPDLWIRPWLPGGLALAFVGGALAFKPTLERLARETDALIVLTAGPAGAFVWHRAEAWAQESLATSVVDTNGCGDAFAAAFTVAWLAGAPVPRALAAGAESAAWVAGQRGAQPHDPLVRGTARADGLTIPLPKRG